MKKFYKKKRFWFNSLVAIVALVVSMSEIIREIDSAYTPIIILGFAIANVMLSLISKELLPPEGASEGAENE